MESVILQGASPKAATSDPRYLQFHEVSAKTGSCCSFLDYNYERTYTRPEGICIANYSAEPENAKARQSSNANPNGSVICFSSVEIRISLQFGHSCSHFVDTRARIAWKLFAIKFWDVPTFAQSATDIKVT